MSKSTIVCICLFLAAAMPGALDTDPHREAAEAWEASAYAWEALARVFEDESPDSFDVSNAMRMAQRAANEARNASFAYRRLPEKPVDSRE